MHKNKAKKPPETAWERTLSPATLLQALPWPVLGVGAAGTVLFANDAACALLQKNPRGLALEAVLGAGSPVLAAARAGRAVTLHDLSFCGTAAATVTVQPLEGEEGGCLVAAHIDALRARAPWSDHARHALRPAQEMARVLAHEIRNPLAGIQAAAQILARMDMAAEDAELVALISGESARILRLVRKVDVFGDAPAARFAPVNVHEVLDRAVQVVRPVFPGLKIVALYDPSLPPLRGDFDGLVQAAINLVRNAAQAAPAGTAGRVVLRSFYDNAAPPHPDTHVKLPLCVAVEDNGPGMPPAVQARIFDPYFTTRPQGEGLGLAVVSKIVDDHGGMIGVDSAPGRTVFRISFPAGGGA